MSNTQPPPNATTQDIQNFIATLANNQTNLQTTLQTLVNNLTSSKKAGKPHDYDGTRGEDARRFMAALELYFNNHSVLSNADVIPRIVATVPFLTGTAAIWITPLSEKINANEPIEYATWAAFKEAFKKHFETASAQQDAKSALKALKQGRYSVGYYAGIFKQHADRTGWSDADLRDRFYDGLAGRVKDALVHTEKPTTTLAQLEGVAIGIDLRQIQRAAEEGKRLVMDDVNTTNTTVPTYFAPSRDPNAMDIDATQFQPRKTDEDFRRMIRGRCYGCGSKNHRRSEGHHERDVCRYCGKVGHMEVVCRQKFFGVPRKQGQQISASNSFMEPYPTYPSPAPAPAVVVVVVIFVIL